MQKELYMTCYDSMIKICNRFTSDDAVSKTLYNDAMFKVFKNIANYEEDGRFMGWVKKIVINTCIDYARIKPEQHTIEINETNALEHSVSEDIINKYSAQELAQIIRKLPEHIALVFNLYVYEEYQHKEIASMLQIPVGTSRYYLSEGRRLLKEMVENKLISLNKIL